MVMVVVVLVFVQILYQICRLFFITPSINWIIEAHNILWSPRLNNQVGPRWSGALLPPVRPSQIGKCQVWKSYPHHRLSSSLSQIIIIIISNHYIYHLKLLPLLPQIIIIITSNYYHNHLKLLSLSSQIITIINSNYYQLKLLSSQIIIISNQQMSSGEIIISSCIPSSSS